MADFELVNLGDIALVRSGYAFKSEDWKPDGIPVVKIANVKGGRLSMEGCSFVDNEVAGDASEFRLKAGDILIAMTGYIGEVARVHAANLPALLNQRVGRFTIRDPKRLDEDFLYQLLMWRAVRTEIEGLGYGSAQPNVSPTLIGNVKVPLPNLGTQRQIASVVGALDDKIDLNREMSVTLEAMARAIFEERASYEAWQERPLGDFVTIFDGPHATPKLASAGPIFLGISNLNSGILDLADLNHVTDEDFATWTRRVTPRSGDLVFSYETRLGQAALIPDGLQCCLGRRMGLLRPKQDLVSPVVLLRAYLSRHFQEVIRRHTISGATVDRIPLREMHAFPILLPAPAQMADLSALLQPLRNKLDANLRENDTLQRLRDLLLPRLMSGEVRVREAETMMAAVA